MNENNTPEREERIQKSTRRISVGFTVIALLVLSMFVSWIIMNCLNALGLDVKFLPIFGLHYCVLVTARMLRWI